MVAMPMSDEFDQEVLDFFKNYRDRGMLKWAGFYLSDHTLKIEKDEKKRHTVYQKRAEMSIEEISKLLLEAYSLQLAVSIQLKNLNDELKYSSDITGYVLGFDDEFVIIDLFGKKEQQVDLNEINNVCYVR